MEVVKEIGDGGGWKEKKKRGGGGTGEGEEVRREMRYKDFYE